MKKYAYLLLLGAIQASEAEATTYASLEIETAEDLLAQINEDDDDTEVTNVKLEDEEDEDDDDDYNLAVGNGEYDDELEDLYLQM